VTLGTPLDVCVSGCGVVRVFFVRVVCFVVRLFVVTGETNQRNSKEGTTKHTNRTKKTRTAEIP